MKLSELLKKHYKCKKVFLKLPEQFEDFDGERVSRLTTLAGGKAYEKLIELVYDLSSVIPDAFDVDEVVEQLDQVINEGDV